MRHICGKRPARIISLVMCGVVAMTIAATPAYAEEGNPVNLEDEASQAVSASEETETSADQFDTDILVAMEEGETNGNAPADAVAAEGNDQDLTSVGEISEADGQDANVVDSPDGESVATDDLEDGADECPDDMDVTTDQSQAPDDDLEGEPTESCEEMDEGLPSEDDEAEPQEDAILLMSAGALRAAGPSTLDGVDISGHNALINIANLDADFVIIKSTEWNPDKKNYTSYTTNRTNNRYGSYTEQADAALAEGMLIGFYHFATSPSMGASWTAQAQGFIDAVSGYIGNAVLVLDWEDTSYSTIEGNVSGAKQWLDYVYEHTGVMPMIYMNKSCTQSHNWSSVANAGYELWGAQYADIKHHSGYQSNPWQSNDNWGAWGSRPTIFQYSSTTTVSGSGGEVDVNKFYGSRDDWIARCGAKEMLEEDTSSALQDNAIYGFAPLPTSNLTIVEVAGNAQLGTNSTIAGYWLVRNLGGGLYTFTNYLSGNSLSFEASPSKGSNVILSGTSSTWRLVKCTNGSFALMPYGFDGLRLDIQGGKNTVSGTNVQLYSSNGTAAQRFFAIKAVGLSEARGIGKTVSDGIYFIGSSADSTKVIDICGGSSSNGANAQLYSANYSYAQDFVFEYQGDGLYVIRNLKSGKVLDVYGGKRVKGTNVQQYAYNGTLAQLWYLKTSGDSYVICSAGSGLALDLTGGKTANGTNVQVYTQNGTAAQAFNISRDESLTEALALRDEGVFVDDGVYSIFSCVADGMVIDISGGSTANGANVQIYAVNGSLAQKFEVSYYGNGFYTIQSAKSGKYVDAKGGGTTNGTNVQQYQGNGSRAQLWYFVPRDDGSYDIRNAKTGLSLDVYGGKTANGTNVQLYSSNDTPAQGYRLEFSPLLQDGTYTFASCLSGATLLVLDVKGGSVASGANVQGYKYNSTDAQRWNIVYQGDGTYIILNAKSGMALDVSGASLANGANVQQYSPNGTSAQLWRIGVSDNGDLTFQNVASGKYLDVAGGKATNGVNIQQYTGNGTAAQSFVVFSGGSISTFVNRMIYYCDVASVGYSQGKPRYDLRDGGSCDCSSLIIGCLKEAGFAVGRADSTRDLRKNLTANGWTVLSWNMGSVRTGDILLCDGYHCCAVVSGSGSSARIAEAWLNENGGTHDGRPGDQTGQETRTRKVYQYPYGGGWQCILRYSA